MSQLTQATVTSILKTILDPELGHNLVDLGLIYQITIPASKDKSELSTITILMTLTSPGCPLAPYFIDTIISTLADAFTLPPQNINVDITFDPPWSPEALSPDLKDELGL